MPDLLASGVFRPSERATVLVVGGARWRAVEVSALLESRSGYQFDCMAVQHSPAALARLEVGDIAAVLAFDDLAGRSAHRAVVERGLSVPVIVLVEETPSNLAQARTRYRDDGAAACLFCEDLNGPLVELAILSAIESHRALETAMSYEAEPGADPETGLVDASVFLRRVRAAIERSDADPGFRYSMLYVDMKKVRVGQRLSQADVESLRAQVARRLARCAHEHVAARLEEAGFAVLVRGFDEGDDLSVIHDLRTQMQGSYALGSDELSLDLGFGIARGRGRDTGAHAAVERAKQSVSVPRAVPARATSRSRPDVSAMDRVRTQLTAALARDEFAVTYQPIVELGSERPYGFEALIRWNHPDGGDRPASDFIRAANDTNLIVPIGYWCFEAAIRQMADWRRDFDVAKALAISVNLSTPQVLDPLFVPRVKSQLLTTGLDASAVRFEIEADTIAKHRERSRALVDELADLGAQVWVEDYGIGECTVDDLRGFPLGGFKIDRQFVSKIDGTEMTSGRIRHIVTAAQSLNVQTLGEGIENALQASVLRWLGCSLGQGYLYARPLAVGDAFAYLARQEAGIHDPR